MARRRSDRDSARRTPRRTRRHRPVRPDSHERRTQGGEQLADSPDEATRRGWRFTHQCPPDRRADRPRTAQEHLLPHARRRRLRSRPRRRRLGVRDEVGRHAGARLRLPGRAGRASGHPQRARCDRVLSRSHDRSTRRAGHHRNGCRGARRRDRGRRPGRTPRFRAAANPPEADRAAGGGRCGEEDSGAVHAVRPARARRHHGQTTGWPLQRGAPVARLGENQTLPHPGGRSRQLAARQRKPVGHDRIPAARGSHRRGLALRRPGRHRVRRPRPGQHPHKSEATGAQDDTVQ